MVDQIEKALRRLLPKERAKLKYILQCIRAGKFDQLDVKKLKQRKNIFRVRKGDWRVIFCQQEDHSISILSLERRSDTTYR